MTKEPDFFEEDPEDLAKKVIQEIEEQFGLQSSGITARDRWDELENEVLFPEEAPTKEQRQEALYFLGKVYRQINLGKQYNDPTPFTVHREDGTSVDLPISLTTVQKI